MKVAKQNAIEAWHFLPAVDGFKRGDAARTQHTAEPVMVGTVLHVAGPITPCEHGLHASRRALDALKYAPGPIACRVRVYGEVIEHDDKLAGSYRECVAMIDATNILHEFACCSAEAALLLADVTDMRCWQAIEAKRAWLRKEIGDKELAAARDAAWDAARAAARATAWDAARAAARAELNTTLESMLLEAMA